jgi:hypothetical protein
MSNESESSQKHIYTREHQLYCYMIYIRWEQQNNLLTPVVLNCIPHLTLKVELQNSTTAWS